MPVAAAGGVSERMVPLVTGGQVPVTVMPGGAVSVTLRPGRDGPVPVVYRDGTGQTFVVPDAALPLLGRVLSPSLFDVSALARDHITGAARIPVRLIFTGSRPAAPPGVTVTSVYGRAARGYLTAASAQVFGAAVSRHAGTAARTGLLFGDLASISLAAPAVPAAAPAGGPLHTLRILATGLTGRPDSHSFVFLTNTDDARLTPNNGLVPIIKGVGTIKVPAGHYSLNAGFFDGPPGNRSSVHVVEINDFTVPATSGVTTVHVRETSATTQVVLTSTPRPVTQKSLVLTFDRVSVQGSATSIAGLGESLPTFVNPQSAAKVGKLWYLAFWLAPGPARGRYSYLVAPFAGDTIPRRQHVSVQPSQVATVVNRTSVDPAFGGGRSGNIFSSPYAPAQYAGTTAVPGEGSSVRYPGGVVGIIYGVAAPMPGPFTTYLVAPSGMPWVLAAGILDIHPRNNKGLLYLDSELRTFTAGHTATVQWGHGPLAPRLGQHTSPWVCQACVAGHTLNLVFSPAADSDPSHFVPFPGYMHFIPPPYPASHLTLLRNGHTLVSTNGAFGAVVRNLPTGPATYQVVLTDDLSRLHGFSQSTHTTTDLTIHYPGHGAALPAKDTCPGQSAATPCQILPALSLNYQLATNDLNTSTSHTQVLHLHVGHASYDGHGSTATITSAKVSVSFDGGRTWHTAHLTGTAGTYTATWPNPAVRPGVHPTLKVTAADSAGNTITQTITNAYTLGTTGSVRRSRTA